MNAHWRSTVFSPSRTFTRTGLGRGAATLMLAAGLAAAWAVPALLSTAAMAQNAAAAAEGDPTILAVTTENALLRSGDASIYYGVAQLKPGTLLKTDGESNGFFRVAYPAGLRAFVKADEVSVDTAGKVAKLVRPSRLLAANLNGGARSSWNPLLADALPAGTELSVLEAVNEGGRAAFYAVAAPAGSRGFIGRSAVRRSTAAETAQHNAAMGVTAAPAATPTTPTTPAPTTPAPTTPANEGAPSMGTLTPPPVAPDPVKPATGTPTAPTAPAAPTPPAEALPDPKATPAAETTPAPVVTPAPAPVPVRPAGPDRNAINQVISMYDRVRQQPLEEAEFEQAIAAIESVRGQLASDPLAKRQSDQLARMADLLRLRQDVRDATRQAEAQRAAINTRQSEFSKQLAEFERQRIYTIIGRLVPSTVYDGVRLPLLYRIQSPEPGTSRTLGYLKPSPELDLVGKLGQIVGIVGDTAFDDTLKATLITPRRVEVVSLAPSAAGSVPGTVSQPAGPSSPLNPGAAPTPASAPAPAPAPAAAPGSGG